MSIEQEKLISMPLNNKQTKAIYKGKKTTKQPYFTPDSSTAYTKSNTKREEFQETQGKKVQLDYFLPSRVFFQLSRLWKTV